MLFMDSLDMSNEIAYLRSLVRANSTDFVFYPLMHTFDMHFELGFCWCFEEEFAHLSISGGQIFCASQGSTWIGRRIHSLRIYNSISCRAHVGYVLYLDSNRHVWHLNCLTFLASIFYESGCVDNLIPFLWHKWCSRSYLCFLGLTNDILVLGAMLSFFSISFLTL